MTVYSQNGWPANDRSLIGTYTVPGTSTRIAMRMGDVSVVLLDWLAWFNAHIEPLDGGVLDDWGYAERDVRGGTDLSNHASGTAADQNATRHPLGKVGTFTADQQSRMNARLGLYRGVLRLGMNYTGRKDDMHVEINAGSAAVAAVANDIRALPIPTGSETEMLILFGKGNGPHGSSHAAILSGPLFVVVADPAAFRTEAEYATKAKGLTSLWVSQSDWDELGAQSKQARSIPAG